MTVMMEYETDYMGHVVSPQKRNVKQTQRDEQAERERAADAEADRLRRRERIKAEIAAAELAEQQRLQAVEAIAAVESHKDVLAADHCAVAAPLQARLRAIEDQQIAAIKSRQPADASLESERAGLLDQLRQMNASLEEAIRREDSILKKLEAERLAAAMRCGTSSLKADLLRTASAPLQVALYVAQTGLRWATARHTAASDALQSANNPRTQAELAAATAELAKKTAGVTAAELACIEE